MAENNLTHFTHFPFLMVFKNNIHITHTVLLFFLILIAFPVIAEQPAKNDTLNLKILFNTYFSSEDNMPFWLTANQNGIFTNENNSCQLLALELGKSFRENTESIWDFSYGTQVVASYSSKTELTPISYWAEVRYKSFIFSIGAKPDPVRFEGLSSSNANMLWSNNARPLPHIRFSTNDFIPISANNKWIFLKALYEENFLFDERYVDDPHLHHKNLYLKVVIKNSWSVIAGLDHWVFWGGQSPDYGDLPGWENYFKYILGSKGGTEFPQTDQENVSGNQVGNYYFEITKELTTKTLSFYWNHPFEDGSGLRWTNFWDGLWGFSVISKNKQKPVSGFLIEFMRSMHQSGSYHQLEADPNFPGRKNGYGNDNYFNHGVYKSGFVHYGNMMGSPFFFPYEDENGIPMGFKSTRMEVLHLGMQGFIVDNLHWQSMVSFSKNYGTYNKPFPEAAKLCSYLLKFRYQLKKSPVQFDLYLAGDSGNDIENRFGGGIGIQYQIW